MDVVEFVAGSAELGHMEIAELPVVPAFQRLYRAGCGLVIAVAMLVFVGGWVLHVAGLRNLIPGTVEMKPLTAIGLFLAAGSLLMLQDTDGGASRRRLGRGCAVALVLLGAAVLGEYVFGWRLGIDELLFRDMTGRAQGIAFPGRFAPTTGLNFVLIGVALLTLDLPALRGWRASELLALPVGLIAAASVIGYLYEIPQFYGPASAAKMAINSAICFLGLAGVVVLARPRGRLVRLATTDDPGGIITRRLLPLAVAIPIMLGWAQVAAVHARLFNARVAAWWLSAVTVVGFAILISRVAARLSRYAAERAVLEAELHHLAGHDPLTGLLNRRRFDEELLQAAAIANRYGQLSSLLILDLDHMKEVNDQLGHQAGDDMLQAVSEIFKDRLRSADRAARLGGDEFGVLLPNTDLAGAAVVAEDFRRRIGACCAPLSDVPWTTVSIGVASFTGNGDGPDQIMARADEAMYNSKRSGGDRAALESTLAVAPAPRSDIAVGPMVGRQASSDSLLIASRPPV